MNRQGFTLIELLICTFIVGVFGLVVAGTAGNFLYALLNSRIVQGKVLNVQHLAASAWVGDSTQGTSRALFSSAVMIQTGGETLTTSTEDRQWAVVEKGQCVEAKLFPYAPWDFTRGGTYHGARLLRVIPCQ